MPCDVQFSLIICNLALEIIQYNNKNSRVFFPSVELFEVFHFWLKGVQVSWGCSGICWVESIVQLGLNWKHRKALGEALKSFGVSFENLVTWIIKTLLLVGLFYSCLEEKRIKIFAHYSDFLSRTFFKGIIFIIWNLFSYFSS